MCHSRKSKVFTGFERCFDVGFEWFYDFGECGVLLGNIRV